MKRARGYLKTALNFFFNSFSAKHISSFTHTHFDLQQLQQLLFIKVLYVQQQAIEHSLIAVVKVVSKKLNLLSNSFDRAFFNVQHYLYILYCAGPQCRPRAQAPPPIR